jgi:hypothetical protein
LIDDTKSPYENVVSIKGVMLGKPIPEQKKQIDQSEAWNRFAKVVEEKNRRIQQK